MSSISKLALNDGTHAPWIAFGTGTALFGKDAADAVAAAIQNGFTHLDGAQMYKNETTLGAGIKASGRPRSELYITTKLDALAPGETPRGRLEESLRQLGVAYVDLYLVHTPMAHEGRIKEVWKGMEETKEAGLTKSIGVSNFTADHLKDIIEVATIPPAVNQIEAHPYVWKALGPTLAIHEKHGIVTASYGGLSPLFRGDGPGPLGPVIEQIRTRLESTRGSPVSNGQVLNRWLKQKGLLVVTTSSKAERIREYIDTENVPELTPEEISLIDATGTNIHRRYFVGNWPPELPEDRGVASSL